jgi:8-oxo-dGTP pyrophosphatase MutT (NUDIX family)
MAFNEHIGHLGEKLKAPLPGLSAQLLMAPVPVGQTIRTIPPPDLNVRNSAVLLLLTGNAHESVEIILTLRSEHLKQHSGQISLPGGRMEPGETPLETALRETCEEIGLCRKKPLIIGNLTSLHVPHTFNLIHPVVAWLPDNPVLKPSPGEVKDIFRVSIQQLTDPAVLKKEVWELRGTRYQVPWWKVYNQVPLWGATAMILSEFLIVWKSL